MDTVYDVTILGAGPVGLFGAFYTGLRGCSVKLIDSLAEPGGQLAALYPEKYIYDVAGFSKIMSKDLVQRLLEQAQAFNPTFCLNEFLTEFSYLDNKIIRLQSNVQEHFTRSLIICTGLGAFSPRKIGDPRIDAYEGRGLSYIVTSKEELRGKRLLIVGGGDTALDWALNLEPIAKAITLIHRRDRFRAHEHSVNQLFASSVDVKTFYELRALHGQEWVTEAVIFNNQTNEEETLGVDHVLLNLGFVSDMGPLKNWGIRFRKNSIVVNARMETNLPAVYAAGDVSDHAGKLKLIVTGFGEAAVAVNFAKNYIDPEAKAFPGHSSTMSALPLTLAKRG
ncbi:MAG: NAD(P)/FAD-dependent oxidoreductase [Candidatus Tectomicrobia bacterium]|nr:NAD(P)/FAD-dependent oxidoreductase [Candidatus Tectomicrobia bacterium]